MSLVVSPDTRQSEQPCIEFCGEIFEPLLSGALFWPVERTLLVADLHLEKMSSFARGGQLLPPYDTRLTLRALASDIAETGARKVICLGDSFHRDEGTRTLPADDRARLEALMRGREWIWLAGNHDPAPHALGGTCAATLGVRGIALSHEPARGDNPQIAGHLHPSARVMLGGRSVRRPCFAHDGRLMIMPAYGAATGNLNILSDAFNGYWARERLEVVMLGRDRAYPVGTRRLVGG